MPLERIGNKQRIQSGPLNLGSEFELPMRQTRRGLRPSIGQDVRQLVAEERRIQEDLADAGIDDQEALARLLGTQF